FAGLPGQVSHQYPIADHTYDVAVTATDEDGSYSVPAAPQFDAKLPTVTTAVVAQLYLDVLGRSADLGGLTNYVQQINAGASLDSVIRGLISSPEYKAHVVNDLYVKYLGRTADDSGLASGVAFLSGGGDPRELAARLIASDVFFQKAGGTNEAYLRALY